MGEHSVLGHGHPKPFRRPAQRDSVPLTEADGLHHKQGFQFRSELFEKRSSTVSRADRPPHSNSLTIPSHRPVLRTRLATPALHRDGHPLQPVGRHQMNAVAKRPLLVVFVDVQSGLWLTGVSPPTQGRKRAQGQKHRVGNQRTDLNMRSQRMPDSPCCASFILLNQVNAARPTTWSSGTNPQ